MYNAIRKLAFGVNLTDNGQLSPDSRGTALILTGGTEATGHEAEAKFQKKTK